MRKSYIELAGGFYAAYMFVVNIIYAAYDSTMYSELTPHRARAVANAWLKMLKVELEREEHLALMREYPHWDNTCPHRRWNRDYTDYWDVEAEDRA